MSLSRRIGVGVVVTAALLAGWYWFSHDRIESAALQELSTDKRRELYARTLSDVQSACAAPGRPSGLTDHCQRQARFILQFPECDAACQALARAQLPPPTR